MLTSRAINAHRLCARVGVTAALLALLLFVHITARAQNSVTVQGGNSEAWKKQPHTTVVGIVRSSPCGWLSIETKESRLYLRAADSAQYFPPEGKEFSNFKRCLNYAGFRVRVTYTAPTGNGYDGEFHVLQVLDEVSPGIGDDVPRFTAPGKSFKVEIHRPAPVKPKPLPEWVPPPKPWATAEGMVDQANCSQFELTITLNITGFTLKLRTSSFRGLPFYASGAAVRDGFNPCKELKGRRAKVEYSLVKGQAYDGELASVEVEE